MLKSGFYLSPRGQYIVELVMVVQNRIGTSCDLNFKNDHIKFDGGINMRTQLKILLSSWIKLE